MGRTLSRPPMFTRLHRRRYWRYTLTNSPTTGARLEVDSDDYFVARKLAPKTHTSL